MKMGDIEESQVSMVIDDEDVDSDIQYEMENEKDLSDSEIGRRYSVWQTF
jgi:hypothetical protein